MRFEKSDKRPATPFRFSDHFSRKSELPQAESFLFHSSRGLPAGTLFTRFRHTTRLIITFTILIVAIAVLIAAQPPRLDLLPSSNEYFEIRWHDLWGDSEPGYILDGWDDTSDLSEGISRAIFEKEKVAKEAQKFGISKENLGLDLIPGQSTVDRARMVFAHLNAEGLNRKVKLGAMYTGLEMKQRAFGDLLKYKQEYDLRLASQGSKAVDELFTPQETEEIREAHAGSGALTSSLGMYVV